MGAGPATTMARRWARGAADISADRAGGAARILAGTAAALLAPACAAAAPRAEALLLRQAGMLAAVSGGGVWTCAAAAAPLAGRALVLLADPALPRGAGAGAMIGAVAGAARGMNRAPFLYKCAPRTAAAARRAGWIVLPVARDAILDPLAFRPDTPARAGLRRRLRKAERAGVTAGPCAAADLPLAAMAALSRDWAARRGGERGLSVGRFAPDYVAGQAVYLAHAGGRLAGFATFHAGARERALDMLRTAADAPEGTVHALIAAAIADAARAGCRRLSLSAAPRPAGAADRLLPRLLATGLARLAGTGLSRFKAGFDPRWETRYAAAPGVLALLRGGLAAGWTILHPPPLPADPLPRPAPLPAPQAAPEPVPLTLPPEADLPAAA